MFARKVWAAVAALLFSLSLVSVPAAASQNDVTIVIVGDVMLDRRPGEGIASRIDPLFPFRGTAHILQAADLAIGNLEVVIADSGVAVPKAYNFRAPPRTLEVLKSAGIDAVSVANNHSGDYGTAAFAEMLHHLTAADIGYAGGGMNLSEARRSWTREVRGTRIALLAYNEVELRSYEATEDRPGLAWLVDERVRQDIAAAKRSADFVIVYPHWGLEYRFLPTERQRQAGRMMIDAGADIVVGAHPHVIQTAEYYGGKWIIYSLGNFVFDDFMDVEAELDEPSRRSWILQLRVRKNQLIAWHTSTARTDDMGEPEIVPEAHEPCSGERGLTFWPTRCSTE